jgi:hypothetical protein
VAQPKLIGGGARRRSHARDLAVAARGARGGDGDPHEVFDGWCGDGGTPAAGLDGGGAKRLEERH